MMTKIKMLKNAILILIAFFGVSYAHCQSVAFYNDFDYFSGSGVSPIKDVTSLPKFYVKCSYDKNKELSEIFVFSKREWMGMYTSDHISVISKKAERYFILGAGKERMGYTRALFQKNKEFMTDTAFVKGDTLIFKLTRKNHITVQFFTNIKTDSIIFKEMNFAFDNQNKMRNSILTSFENFTGWFDLGNKAFRIVGGTIKLKRDTVLVWQYIKPPNYSGLIDVTKKDFKDKPSMPLSLFWLKQTGLLY